MTKTLRKVVLDTNVYIGWLNAGLHEEVMIGAGLVRYLSSVVLMELRTGASTLPARRALDNLMRTYDAVGRHVAPTKGLFDGAGRTLRLLKEHGREIRRASLVNDVLVAHSARSIGAAVITRDRDFEAIRSVLDFDLEIAVA